MKVKVFKLKHHPLNEKIYSLSGLDSLMESIKLVGLLEPPTIDQNCTSSSSLGQVLNKTK